MLMRVSLEMVTAIQHKNGDRSNKQIVSGLELLGEVARELTERGCRITQASVYYAPELHLSDGHGLAGLNIEVKLDRQTSEYDWFEAHYRGVRLIWAVPVPQVQAPEAKPSMVL